MAINVLIVDDDEGIRLLLKKIIVKSGGFDWIGEAEDGEAALRLSWLPTWVSDFQMPIRKVPWYFFGSTKQSTAVIRRKLGMDVI